MLSESALGDAWCTKKYFLQKSVATVFVSSCVSFICLELSRMFLESSTKSTLESINTFKRMWASGT